jgi:hypothetical protein
MAEETYPPFKIAKIEISKTISRRQHFQRVHKKLLNHKDVIFEALQQLESDWAGFCFVKILFCNADESCNFTEAYCKTMRNVQEKNPAGRRIVWIPDLFDVALLKSFLDNENVEEQILDKHLVAFEKLGQFLDTVEGKVNFIGRSIYPKTTPRYAKTPQDTQKHFY